MLSPRSRGTGPAFPKAITRASVALAASAWRRRACPDARPGACAVSHAERALWAAAIAALCARSLAEGPVPRLDHPPHLRPQSSANVRLDPRENEPWTAAGGPVPARTVSDEWSARVRPDAFVGRAIELRGYLVCDADAAWLAQTPEEVRAFARQRAHRPRSRPSSSLIHLIIGPDSPRDCSRLPSAARVAVRGVLRPPPDPCEPDASIRWARGVWLDVQSFSPPN